jgi:hypothetical protein
VLLKDKKIKNSSVMYNIPSIDRKEWRELVTGRIDVILKYSFFQLKVNQTVNLVKRNKLSIEKAVEEMHDLCSNFRQVKEISYDMETIFGKAETVHETQQLSDTILDEKNELSVEKPKKLDSINHKEVSSVKSRIEEIKKDAIKREEAFKQQKIEIESKFSKDKKVREESKIRANNDIVKTTKIEEEILAQHKTDKSNSEEQRIQEEIKSHKKTHTVKNEKNKVLEIKEKESLRQASIRRRENQTQKQREKEKNRTFFQKLFDIDSD